MAKIQPAVLSIKFEVGEGENDYIDLSQSASIVNRRFYRQGLNWAVSGFTISSGPIGPAPAQGLVTILKIPNTWCASNAWHKTYAAWKGQQDAALKAAGAQSAAAKFRDFKIHANQAHVTKGFNFNLIPQDATSTSYATGEWFPSEIVIPNTAGVVGDTTERYLHMVGTDMPTSFGLISNYGTSRAYPQSPDPVHPDVGASFFAEMLNVGMDNVEVLENATNINDDLPYDQDNYPGGGTNAPTLEIVHEQVFVQSTSSTSRRLSGTTVPCGLLEIVNDLSGPIDVFVHLVAGPSRGYLTQPMQDM